MSALKEYDAYLTFSPISHADQQQIVRLLADHGLEIEVYENALEFSCEGRDSNDNVVKIFVAIAQILRNAEGELRCEIDEDDEVDPRFEFFTIANSKLWKQSGRIVREQAKDVVPI